MVSTALWRKSGVNILTKILGYYYEDENNMGSLYPIGGLAWVMAPPHSIHSVIFNPIHSVLHTVAILFLAGYTSRMWIQFSGESAHDHAQQLTRNGWIIKGYRDVEYELNRYIPTAALTGGMILGVLSLAADIFGTLGSGSGLLMAASALIRVAEEMGAGLP